VSSPNSTESVRGVSPPHPPFGHLLPAGKHWGERFDESTLSDPSWDLVEKSDTEGFAPTPYE
jgi:hypothetical protein